MEVAGEVERKADGGANVEEGLHEQHVHMHTHTGDGHAHGSIGAGKESSELIRHQVISQVRQFLKFLLPITVKHDGTLRDTI